MSSGNSDLDSHVLVEIHEDGVIGSVTIAPQALIEIIEHAVAVSDTSAHLVMKRWNRGKRLDLRSSESRVGNDRWHARKGIRVRLGHSTIDADVNVSVPAGANVPDVANGIKCKIGETIDRMLGLRVGTINVHIDEIAPQSDQQGN